MLFHRSLSGYRINISCLSLKWAVQPWWVNWSLPVIKSVKTCYLLYLAVSAPLSAFQLPRQPVSSYFLQLTLFHTVNGERGTSQPNKNFWNQRTGCTALGCHRISIYSTWYWHMSTWCTPLFQGWVTHVNTKQTAR